MIPSFQGLSTLANDQSLNENLLQLQTHGIMSHAILELTQPLKALVSSKFAKAYDAKDIIFSSTSLAILTPKEDLSVSFLFLQSDICSSAHRSTGSVEILPSSGKEAQEAGARGPVLQARTKIRSIRQSSFRTPHRRRTFRGSNPHAGVEQIPCDPKPFYHCHPRE